MTAITHRVDVRRFAAQKQAALAAHRSQVSRRNRSGQLFRLLIALPAPVFGLLGGCENVGLAFVRPHSGR